MENKWWTDKDKEIQFYADTNEMQKFYDAIRAVYGPRHHSMHPVRARYGVTSIKDQPGVLSCWAEHLSELLNCINPTDSTFIDLIPQLPIIPDLDQLPTFHEVCIAVKGLKNNKAAGPDGLPAEVFKRGGYLLKHRFHRFITSTWSSGCVPQQWKDANIVTIYKRKGDK